MAGRLPEEWHSKLPDPTASGHYVDVFAFGARVVRTEYVTVDGGRGDVPLPDHENLTVPRDYARVVGLVHGITRGSGPPFGHYMERIGIRETDEPWPRGA